MEDELKQYFEWKVFSKLYIDVDCISVDWNSKKLRPFMRNTQEIMGLMTSLKLKNTYYIKILLTLK
jgi:hypothetical protein